MMNDTMSPAIIDEARGLVIATPADYTRGGELLKAVKGLRAQIAETFQPIISKAHQAHKEAIVQLARAERPLIDAEAVLKTRLVEYSRREQEERRKEEARLREILRKEEEDRQLAEAVALEAEGRASEAEVVISEPTIPPVVILPKMTPKIAGISERGVWKFRIVNAAAIPREYLIPDEHRIGRFVRALRGEARIPGIEVYEETQIAAGRC